MVARVLRSVTAAPAGLLLIGGEGPCRAVVEPFLPVAGPVVAADSGFDLALRLGIRPDWVVGDLDSVQAWRELEAFPAARIRRAPAAKDQTDAEMGLDALVGLGCRRVIVAGGGGGRIDHLLGVFGLFQRDPRLQVWLTAGEHMEVIDGSAQFHGHRDCTVSLFPLTETAESLGSRGLRWPLDGLCLRRGYGSLSNVVVADEWRVSVGRGRLLMIRNLAQLPLPAAAAAGGGR